MAEGVRAGRTLIPRCAGALRHRLKYCEVYGGREVRLDSKAVRRRGYGEER